MKILAKFALLSLITFTSFASFEEKEDDAKLQSTGTFFLKKREEFTLEPQSVSVGYTTGQGKGKSSNGMPTSNNSINRWADLARSDLIDSLTQSGLYDPK